MRKGGKEGRREARRERGRKKSRRERKKRGKERVPNKLMKKEKKEGKAVAVLKNYKKISVIIYFFLLISLCLCNSNVYLIHIPVSFFYSCADHLAFIDFCFSL